MILLDELDEWHNNCGTKEVEYLHEYLDRQKAWVMNLPCPRVCIIECNACAVGIEFVGDCRSGDFISWSWASASSGSRAVGVDPFPATR